MGEPTKMLTLAEYKALKATAAKAVAELNALREKAVAELNALRKELESMPRIHTCPVGQEPDDTVGKDGDILVTYEIEEEI